MKQRASYREAIAWIAFNDEPGEMDPTVVGELISVMLVADLFGMEYARVAKDVIAKRRQMAQIEARTDRRMPRMA